MSVEKEALKLQRQRNEETLRRIEEYVRTFKYEKNREEASDSTVPLPADDGGVSGISHDGGKPMSQLSAEQLQVCDGDDSLAAPPSEEEKQAADFWRSVKAFKDLNNHVSLVDVYETFVSAVCREEGELRADLVAEGGNVAQLTVDRRRCGTAQVNNETNVESLPVDIIIIIEI